MNRDFLRRLAQGLKQKIKRELSPSASMKDSECFVAFMICFIHSLANNFQEVTHTILILYYIRLFRHGSKKS